MRRAVVPFAVCIALAAIAAPCVVADDHDASRLQRTELLPPLALEQSPPTSHATPTAPSTSASTTPPVAVDAGVTLRSTSYCLTSTMASGRRTYVGAVASNRYNLGTRLVVTPNPWGDPGMVFTVEDRHARADGDGYPTELDFAMPGECNRALAWGNRTHVVARVVD